VKTLSKAQLIVPVPVPWGTAVAVEGHMVCSSLGFQHNCREEVYWRRSASCPPSTLLPITIRISTVPWHSCGWVGHTYLSSRSSHQLALLNVAAKITHTITQAFRDQE